MVGLFQPANIARGVSAIFLPDHITRQGMSFSIFSFENMSQKLLTFFALPTQVNI